VKGLRYEITGEWSGPKNPAGDYTRLCYRETTTNEGLIQFVSRTHGIQFSDGTMLFLRCRPLGVTEQGKSDMLGYSELVHDCFMANVDSVDALNAPAACPVIGAVKRGRSA
jgi:hypothetical protein